MKKSKLLISVETAFYTAAFGIVPVATIAAAKTNDWENQAVFRINKEPAHCTFIPFDSVQKAMRGDKTTSIYYKSLNGKWRFKWSPDPQSRPVDFYQDAFDVSGWDKIDVPSSWQLKGYGTPLYSNITYPFKKDPPGVMGTPPKSYTNYETRNPVGSYKTTFTIPTGWKNKEIFINFDGVDSAFYLWINGKKVGYSQDSRTPAEFNITNYLRDGQNKLAAQVYRYSDGSYLEDQDMWRLSGIFRDVYLVCRPKVYLRDFFAKATLDDDYQNGLLEVELELQNSTDGTASAQVEVSLLDSRGQEVFSPMTLRLPTIVPSGTTCVTNTVSI